jgi:hypothetical protein
MQMEAGQAALGKHWEARKKPRFYETHESLKQGRMKTTRQTLGPHDLDRIKEQTDAIATNIRYIQKHCGDLNAIENQLNRILVKQNQVRSVDRGPRPSHRMKIKATKIRRRSEEPRRPA